jgi:SAM-dependent methyltransferase
MVESVDKVFAGSIPRLYEEYLVPLIFAPYAADLARRITAIKPSSVLELAAGTGVVTRAVAKAIASPIVATDLNAAMLEQAKSAWSERPVEWRVADAMKLPFDNASFDTVICQFGWMFFPDKGAACAEARRVLRPGGTLLFNVWDRIEENEFADVVTGALTERFPEKPPRFLARTPHGHFDRAAIEKYVSAGGFRAPPKIETVTARSRGPTPRHPAIAYCQGTPLRNEIEALAPDGLAEATAIAAAAIEKRFGSGAVDGKIQALVMTVQG